MNIKHCDGTSQRTHTQRPLPASAQQAADDKAFRVWQRVRGGILLLFSCIIFAGLVRADEALVERVESVGITVSDLDRAVEFYQDALSFREIRRYEVDGEEYERLYGLFGMRLKVAELVLGDEKIELMQFLAPQGRPIPFDTKSNDRWFQHIAVITSDMDRAYRHLRELKVTHASSGPQVLPDWNPNAGGIAAFYFRDPDGNHLEVLQFPKGKGSDKWHASGGALFLGIDHTAIVVADTDKSTHFYQDLLGMSIAGRSENYGIEQERLNNVFGARLRITALRASQGPGVEFLEYIAPQGGRPMPSDTSATDLWHWQINVRSPNINLAWERFGEAETDIVSPGPAVLPNANAGFRQGLMIRDPDGHAMMVQQQ